MWRALLLAGVLLSTSCTRTVLPATDRLDWSAIAEQQMILIRTTDPEGQSRTPRLWLVVLDGFGYVRSADTRWSRDIARDPTFLLIADGFAYPVRATRVSYGTPEHERVMEAFADKYGWLSRTVLRVYTLLGRLSGPADVRIQRLEALEVGAASAPSTPSAGASRAAIPLVSRRGCSP